MARYIKKHGEEFISKSKQKDFMFAEKKPKMKRPPAVYSNPQFHLIYGYNEQARLKYYLLNDNDQEKGNIITRIVG